MCFAADGSRLGRRPYQPSDPSHYHDRLPDWDPSVLTHLLRTVALHSGYEYSFGPEPPLFRDLENQVVHRHHDTAPPRIAQNHGDHPTATHDSPEFIERSGQVLEVPGNHVGDSRVIVVCEPQSFQDVADLWEPGLWSAWKVSFHVRANRRSHEPSVFC